MQISKNVKDKMSYYEKNIINSWCALTTMLIKAQQPLTLDEIKIVIEKDHPTLKMLDAEARSMDEGAKERISWMAPELGAGFYQTPYDPNKWKSMNGNPGMGLL